MIQHENRALHPTPAAANTDRVLVMQTDWPDFLFFFFFFGLIFTSQTWKVLGVLRVGRDLMVGEVNQRFANGPGRVPGSHLLMGCMQMLHQASLHSGGN